MFLYTLKYENEKLKTSLILKNGFPYKGKQTIEHRDKSWPSKNLRDTSGKISYGHGSIATVGLNHGHRIPIATVL